MASALSGSLRTTTGPASACVRGPHHKGYQSVPADFEDAIAYGAGHVVGMTATSVTSTWASGDLISTAA
ncbi:hypothetical protein [Nonomuraea sp. 10N515B]|uniref:hypothetical protein n=1 Tax=Nonomuraea sp. 10N515B TaxID=3457422 RepID=UPI003FCDA072